MSNNLYLHRTDIPSAYYIFDMQAQKFLSSEFNWNSRGAKIIGMEAVKKSLRVIAERNEEALRPTGWQTIPHTYADLPAFTFIPSYIAVTDDNKSPILRARDVASHFLIQVWQRKGTN